MNVRTKIVNMSAAALLDELVTTKERKTRSRVLAYKEVGREIDRSESWVRNAIRDGVEHVHGAIQAKLDALLIRGIEAQLVHCEALLEMALARGDRPDSPSVLEVKTRAQRLLARLDGSAHADR